MEFVPGKHAETYSDKLIHQLATYQAKIHLIGEKYAREHKPNEELNKLRETEFIHLITQAQLQNKETAALIERGKNYTYDFASKLPQGYSHFDFDAENILSDDKDSITGILDFDDLQYAPLVMCLAYTLWDVLITSDDPHKIKKFVGAYEAIRPLSAKEREAIRPIMLFRHYVIAALDVLRDDMDKENLAYYLKYERYLQRSHF